MAICDLFDRDQELVATAKEKWVGEHGGEIPNRMFILNQVNPNIKRKILMEYL